VTPSSPFGEQTPFVVGVNLPWHVYGCDFGASSWSREGGIGRLPRPHPLEDAFARLAAHGTRLVRWFVLCDGRSGLEWDEDGTPLGLDAYFQRDFDAALTLAAAYGLQLIPVLFDFLWFHAARPRDGVQMGGHADVVADEGRRRRLVTNVVEPILRQAAHSPVIHSWDILNEPEWATRGVGAWLEDGGVWPAEMRAFLTEAAERVHALTDHPVTVGSATARWRGLVSGLGLDFYQFHWYDHLEGEAPLERPVAAMKLDRPAILGEFPTHGSARSVSTILDAARAAGYRGALAWSALGDDEASDYFASAEEIMTWRVENGGGAPETEPTLASAAEAPPTTTLDAAS
jgi:hypothetical protein